MDKNSDKNPDKRTDYSFMKSGFSMLKEPEKTDPELILNVLSLVTAFSDKALEDSCKYVEHGLPYSCLPYSQFHISQFRHFTIS